MSTVKVQGNASGTGSITLASPNTNNNRTLTLPDVDGTLPVLGANTFTAQQTIPTINLTGGQIAFPAAQSASSDANTLDDYEEGTWTPTLYFGTTQATLTTSSGWYVKVGKLVTVTVQIALSSKNGGTGSCELRNFPFANASGNEGVRGGAAIGYYTGFSGTNPYFMLSQSSTSGAFRQGNSSDFNNSTVADGSSVWFSYSYVASA